MVVSAEARGPARMHEAANSSLNNHCDHGCAERSGQAVRGLRAPDWVGLLGKRELEVHGPDHPGTSAVRRKLATLYDACLRLRTEVRFRHRCEGLPRDRQHQRAGEPGEGDFAVFHGRFAAPFGSRIVEDCSRRQMFTRQAAEIKDDSLHGFRRATFG